MRYGTPKEVDMIEQLLVGFTFIYYLIISSLRIISREIAFQNIGE